MKKWRIAALAVLLAWVIPVAALANAAEPPSLIILVRGGPEDLKVSVRVTDVQTKQVKEKPLELARRPWTRYYQWYDVLTPWVLENWYHMGPEVNVELAAQGEGVDLVLPLENTPKSHAGYSRLVTLDLKKGVILPGEQPFWWVPLKIALRVLSTLLLEGAVFWLFGYREKGSWETFLFVNLLTQAGLNVFLMGQHLDSHGIFVMTLVFAEPVIFLLELVLFCVFIREKRKLVTAACTVVANLASLALGWKVMELFPL